MRIADFFVGADFFRGAPFRVGGLRPSLTAVISILPGCFQRMSSRFAADSRLEGTRFEPSVPLRRATLIETPPSNSAIPPQRAKPVPSEQEPPVPCVSAPNQDPIGKDDNVLILIRIGLDGGVPIGTPRSFQFSASYQYDGLRPLGVPIRCRNTPQWRAPLGSLNRPTDNHRPDTKAMQKALSQFIIPPRAQASRRCETQASLGGKPPSFATASIP